MDDVDMEIRKIKAHFQKEAAEFKKFSNQEQVFVPDGPVGDKLEKALPSLFKLWDAATTSFYRRNLFIEKLKEYLSDDEDNDDTHLNNKETGKDNNIKKKARYNAALLMTRSEMKSLKDLLTKYGPDYKLIRKREELGNKLKKLRKNGEMSQGQNEIVNEIRSQYDTITSRLKQAISNYKQQGTEILYRGYPYIRLLNANEELLWE